MLQVRFNPRPGEISWARVTANQNGNHFVLDSQQDLSLPVTINTEVWGIPDRTVVIDGDGIVVANEEVRYDYGYEVAKNRWRHTGTIRDREIVKVAANKSRPQMLTIDLGIGSIVITQR